jgi:circadian clock protein KaiC
MAPRKKPVGHKRHKKAVKAKYAAPAKNKSKIHKQGKIRHRSQKIPKHMDTARVFRNKRMKQPKEREYVRTGIAGFDQLFEIPKGSSVLLSGGAGSGKTILGLQILANAAKRGEKALYMSFEETEDRLQDHMKDFGWDYGKLKSHMMIKRFNMFDVGRALDAMMAKAEGELLIDVKPIILPSGFKPDVVVIDSLTAIASVFAGKESYRIYVENLFRYFQEMGITVFFITETEEVPSIFSPKGVDEFLADGVVVLYNVKKGDIRERAIEVLKMRGTKHTTKIVAIRIVDGAGIEVYPDQEVFGNIR